VPTKITPQYKKSPKTTKDFEACIERVDGSLFNIFL